MNILNRDPLAFVAKTFDQAVLKLEKLIEISCGSDQWGPNIIAATKDLLPQYQEKFVRYLANPSGTPGNFTIKAATPEELSKLQDSNPNVNFKQKQKTTVIKRQGDTTYLFVESDNDSEDDEKNPIHEESSC